MDKGAVRASGEDLSSDKPSRPETPVPLTPPPLASPSAGDRTKKVKTSRERIPRSPNRHNATANPGNNNHVGGTTQKGHKVTAGAAAAAAAQGGGTEEAGQPGAPFERHKKVETVCLMPLMEQTAKPKAKGKQRTRSRESTNLRAKSATLDTLPINSLIETENEKYKVVKKLGSGGCGEAFIVKHLRTKKQLAVKAEFAKMPEKRLKRELDIYRCVEKIKKTDRKAFKHLLKFADYGELENVASFLFLPLCADSLEGAMKKGFPTLATGFELALQSLEAVREFHELGFMHRDIKAANFVINEKRTVVYLIDFGMAVRYITDIELMPKTSVYDFIGTVHYAPRAAHKGLPQSRRDDMEAWLYVALEFFVPDILPWAHRDDDQKEVERMKDNLFCEMYKSRLEQAPLCFNACIPVIKSCSQVEAPDYKAITHLIQTDAQTRGCTLRRPFDFSSTPVKVVEEMYATALKAHSREATETAVDKDRSCEPGVSIADPEKSVIQTATTKSKACRVIAPKDESPDGSES